MTLVEVVVALAITGLTIAGIVTGYIYCSTATIKDALYMAANARVHGAYRADAKRQMGHFKLAAGGSVGCHEFPRRDRYVG